MIVPTSDRNERREFAERLAEYGFRITNFERADRMATREILKANDIINFRFDHRHSVFEVADGRLLLSSMSSGYSRMLMMPSDKLVEIYRNHIRGAHRRGR